MKQLRYAGRAMYYAPSYAYGTKRWRRYIRREPHNAIGCDALCDVHSGRRDRLRSRAQSRRIAKREAAAGIELLAMERSPEVML